MASIINLDDDIHNVFVGHFAASERANVEGAKP